MNAQLAEVLRLLHNLIRLGTVAEVDHAAARVRVATGKLITDWLPWAAQRAGTSATWWAPTVGEQVILFCPGGDLNAGVALPGLYANARPAPSADPHLHTTHYPDGAVIQYNSAQHALSATLPDGSSASVTANAVTANADQVTSNAPQTTCTGNLTVDGNLSVAGHSALNGGVAAQGGSGSAAVVITGGMQATDDVVAGGISLRNHTHGGVAGGSSSTGGPQ